MSPEALSAISSGAGLFGDVLGWFGARQNTKDAQAWQEKMWNRQNEYNLPINQRQRLEAGGFNPHLMYGTGSLANTAGSVGSPTPPAMKQLELGRHLQMYIENKRANEALQLNKDAMQLSRDRLEQQKFMDFFKMANIQADTLNKGLSIQSGSFDLNLKKKLEANTIEQSNKVLDKLSFELTQGKTSLEQQIEKFNQDKSLWKYETQKAKYEADITKTEAYTKFIEANNLPAFQKIRLQQLVRDYANSINEDKRRTSYLVQQKIRTMLQEQKLNGDQIEQFFRIINPLK